MPSGDAQKSAVSCNIMYDATNGLCGEHKLDVVPAVLAELLWRIVIVGRFDLFLAEALLRDLSGKTLHATGARCSAGQESQHNSPNSEQKGL